MTIWPVQLHPKLMTEAIGMPFTERLHQRHPLGFEALEIALPRPEAPVMVDIVDLHRFMHGSKCRPVGSEERGA